jgi:DNA-binding HxlR family transcriptional regulator
MAAFASSAHGQSLEGSKRSVDIQNRVARQHDFTFVSTTAQAKRFVELGYLVRVQTTRDYVVNRISHPYARPEVELFLTRLGRQYRSACGERLVVTSLTRPTSRQPRNASIRSVHPTGMAMDIRRSGGRACRSWLEQTLLTLEQRGVLEATRESRPPHYHVALFPSQYAAYVERKLAAVGRGGEQEYRVRSGDSLWSIAQRHGTSIAELRSANDLRSSRIYAGQMLTVPAGK